MKTETTMRCHLTLVRMAIIKKPTNNKCWRGWGEKGTLLQIGATTMENSIEVPQNLKIELPYDPEIPLLGIYPDKTLIQKET